MFPFRLSLYTWTATKWLLAQRGIMFIVSSGFRGWELLSFQASVIWVVFPDSAEWGPLFTCTLDPVVFLNTVSLHSFLVWDYPQVRTLLLAAPFSGTHFLGCLHFWIFHDPSGQLKSPQPCTSQSRYPLICSLTTSVFCLVIWLIWVLFCFDFKIYFMAVRSVSNFGGYLCMSLFLE